MLNTLSLITLTFTSARVISLPVDGLDQLAIGPLLPVLALILVLACAAFIFGGKSPTETYKDEKEVHLAILGPNEAGKTTLWNSLHNEPSSKVYQETEGKIRTEFYASDILWSAVKVDNVDEKVKFSGYDINGNGDFIRTDWHEIIQSSEMLIFIFNSYKYLNDINYQRDVNQRLQYVKTTIDALKDDKKRNVWLVGSYADKLNNRKEDWKNIISCLNQKTYRDLTQNHACFNLTDKEEMKKYINKMFNK